MNIGTYTLTKKQIIGLVILVILVIGLVVGMILVSNRQIFKPKATGNTPEEAFTFTDQNNNPLPRSGNTITTDNQHIKIKLDDPGLLTAP